jgi:hypothetical protein
MNLNPEPVPLSDRAEQEIPTSAGTAPPNLEPLEGATACSLPRGHVQDSRFTIFAIPKPFVGEARQIQLNAIGSWRQLAPNAEILLLGDEEGIAEVANNWGLKHVGGLRRNAQGTPLLDSAFEIASKAATTPYLMYCNCDVIFLKDLPPAIDWLAQLAPPEFLGFGRRTDLKVERLLNFENPNEVESIRSAISQHGRKESIVCKEYFIFRKGTFGRIPAFAVGRGNWDNWMVRSSKDRSIPVIDLSKWVTAVHQSHAYAHVGRSRLNCYVWGVEAKENQRLAGGRNLISGSTPDWRLDRRGLNRIPFSGLQLAFWQDLPRFLWLMKKLVIG